MVNDQALDETTETEERVMVRASMERCFEVATDFASYPEWSSDVEKVEVVGCDDDGRAAEVVYWARAMGRSTRYVLQYDYSEAPNRLTWQLSEGDIEKSLFGEYRFEIVGGQTEIVYRLKVELNVPLPGFLRRRAEGRILGAALTQLKSRAER